MFFARLPSVRKSLILTLSHGYRGYRVRLRKDLAGGPSSARHIAESRRNAVNRARNVIRDGGRTVRGRFSAFASQSPRTILLGTILLASALSAVMAFILAQYCSIDVFSSLTYAPQDCFRYWGIRVGRHCFTDYTEPMTLALRPNPWEPYPGAAGSINYPPGALVPQLAFGLLGKLLHAPLLGLFGYLLASTLAVLTPGWWAARGARGLEGVVVFVACGAAAIPAWAAIDRANSVVFAVPIALVFLVALCRQRWGLVVIMVVLAALVKPQFAVLGVVLFAARQWRMGGIAVAGGVVSNLAAYLLWPRDFPDTITQSTSATVGAFPFDWLTGLANISFGRAVLAVPDAIAILHNGGKVPDGYLLGPRLLAGYAVVIVVTGSLLALGRRIPPVMAGTVLLATASLFPAMTNGYYLVFVLPIAALVVRDPDGPPGSGIFDRFAALGDRRRAVGICVSLVTALTIAQICLPSPPILVAIKGQMGASGIVGYTPIVATTATWSPYLWLIACATILVAYARRRTPSPGDAERAGRESLPDIAADDAAARVDQPPDPDRSADAAAEDLPRSAELMTESSSRST